MKISKKIKKKLRVRKQLKENNLGSRLRLSVFRSSKNFSAQIIDDVTHKTIASASSLDKSQKKDTKISKSEIVKNVALSLADKAIEKKIKKIYFDRGAYKYHGRVKHFADTLREKGLAF